MKNILKKSLLILLTLVLACGCLFSCGEEKTTDDPQKENEQGNNEDKPSVAGEDFFDGHPEDFVIVYPLGANSTIKDAAMNLKSVIKDTYGVDLRCADDSILTKNEFKKAILIGKTDRKVSTTSIEGLSSNDFAIVRSGNYLVLNGGSNALVAKAVEKFISNFMGKDDAKPQAMLIPADLNYKWIFADECALITELAEYKITYGTMAEKIAADALSSAVESYLGKKMTVFQSSSTATDTSKEVLIGSTGKKESNEAMEGLGYADYSVSFSENKIVIAAGSTEMLCSAVDYLMTLLTNKGVESLSDTTGNSVIKHTENTMLAGFNSFTPVWSSTYQPKEWQMNVTEKMNAITAMNGRNASAVVGGDTVNYPSGSPSAIASAIKAGADVISLRYYLTKDGVAVVVPNDNLAGCTDAAAIQQQIGAPLNMNVTNWTWTQVKELHLTDKDGKVTDDKVLLLFEAMKLCVGRCFFMLAPIGQALDTNQTIQMVLAAGAVSSYYVPDDLGLVLTCPNIVTELNNWLNVAGYADNAAIKSAVNAWRTAAAANGHFMRPLMNDDFTTAISQKYGKDTPERWEELRSVWRTFLFTDDIVKYCKYISEKFVSNLVKDDQNFSNETFSLNKGDLTYRVMLFSDPHYYYTSNIKSDNLGWTREERKQLFLDTIKKEAEGRGIDAVIVLGDLATDNWTGPSGTTYAKTFYDDVLAPSATQYGIGVAVLAGNHDSFSNEKWKEMFGTDRQFSFNVGEDAIFVMCDTFDEDNPTSHGGSKDMTDNAYWGSYVTTVAKANPDKDIYVVSHYFSSVSYIATLKSDCPNIVAYFDGHTHQYIPTLSGETWRINLGDFGAYTCNQTASGAYDFNYMEQRCMWGYLMLEGTDTNVSAYHVWVPATYEASQMTVTIAEELKGPDLILK